MRAVSGDLAETVELIDEFVHPKTQRKSLCFRINYRHMDRSLTNEEIDKYLENKYILLVYNTIMFNSTVYAYDSISYSSFLSWIKVSN